MPPTTAAGPNRRIPCQFRPISIDCTLLRPRGDLDIATADEFDRALRAAVTADQPRKHLVLDLGEVDFLDCCALSAIIGARNRLPGRFWLADPPAHVLRLLELTGLRDAFGILDGTTRHGRRSVGRP